ncbi:hypothetical protein [Sulfitobacter sp. R86518]|uniref:hypothetical protein n=1 Tax=Sulfitobacter sp. R86518 TaxID=3093858 RepID=UPI0036DCEFED
MTLEDFIVLLERFQTSIVGFFGFLGVIITLFVTSWSSKKGHQREVTTRRNALRRILAAELRNYARALRKNVDQQKPTEANISVGRIRRLLSDHLTADLGLLALHEIDIVVNALITLDGMDTVLSNIATQTLDDRFLFASSSWEELCNINATAAEALDYAVQALEISNKG